jgi:transcriptional regulator with XRE-family HTH domain
MTFGEKLRELRLRNGLSQGALAGQLGIHWRSIMNYENGKCFPKDAELYPKIARIFSVSVEYLMTNEDSFVAEAYAQGGNRGKRQAQELVGRISGLFAGGDLTDEDMDAALKAIQDAYWIAKAENKKHTPKRYLKSDNKQAGG